MDPALPREEQVLLAREVDGVDDVRGPGALHDQRRPAIDEPVPDRARIVLAGITGAQHLPPHALNESLNRFRVDHHLGSQLTCPRSSSAWNYEPFAYSSAVRDSNSKPTTGSSPTTQAS